MEGWMFVGIIKGESGKWMKLYSNGEHEYKYIEYENEFEEKMI